MDARPRELHLLFRAYKVRFVVVSIKDLEQIKVIFLTSFIKKVE